MIISAKVTNSYQKHSVTVKTNDNKQTLSIPGKKEGLGSAINGGELLFLALATCFCNDIYREAKKKGINITKVEVEASGEFSSEGEPGHSITYQAKVEGDASKVEIDELIRHTDKVSEIQNTLRKGVPVKLAH